MVRSGAGFQPVAFGYAKARTPGNQPPQAGSLCHQNSHPFDLIYSLNRVRVDLLTGRQNRFHPKRLVIEYLFAESFHHPVARRPRSNPRYGY